MKMSLGRYTTFDTVFHRMDSRVKLVGMIVFLVSCFLSYGTGYMNIVVYLAIFLILLVFTFLAKASFASIFRSLKGLWFMILLLFVINIFIQTSTTGDVAFYIGSLAVYWRTIINIIYIFIRLVLVLMVTNIFTSTTKPMDMTFAIEWLLYPLKLIKIPVHKFAMALSLALRFIPTLSEEAARIQKAQASRGIDYRQGKFKDKVKSIVSLVIPLFMTAFTESGELADAMEARGYNPDAKRTRYRVFKWGVRDTVSSIVLAIFLTGIILLAVYQFDLFAYLGVTLPALS